MIEDTLRMIQFPLNKNDAFVKYATATTLVRQTPV